MSITQYKTRHGHLYHFATDDTIGASLLSYGEWAESEIYLLSHIIRPNDHVLDIGANIGCHSLAFSRLVGPNGLVLAMEAQPMVFQLLAANMATNGAFQVKCLNVLVGSKEGNLRLPLGESAGSANFGAVSFVKFMDGDPTPKPSDGAPVILVPCSMISVDSMELPRCDVIKIDVEGMELDVLRGSHQTILKNRPVIYFEQVGTTNLQETYDFLSDNGYVLWWHRANPFNPNNFKKHRFNIFGGSVETNVLAFPTDREEAFSFITAELIRLDPRSDCPKNGKADWMLPMDAYAELAAPFSHEALDVSDWEFAKQFRFMQKSFEEKLKKEAAIKNGLERKLENVIKANKELKASVAQWNDKPWYSRAFHKLRP